MRKIKIIVNGSGITREIADNRLLIDFIRYDLGLTGTKEGCSVGVCGIPYNKLFSTPAVFNAESARRARLWLPRRCSR